MNPPVLLFTVIVAIGTGCASISAKTANPEQNTDSGCGSFPTLPETQDYISLHRRIVSSEIAEFDSLALNEMPLILVHGSNCALLMMGGEEIQVVRTKDPIVMLSPVFSFYMASDMSLVPDEFKGLAQALKRSNPEIQDLLDKHGIGRALYLRVDFDQQVAGSALAAFKSRTAFLGFMMLHENFHLHGQFPQWFNQRNREILWPKWDQQPNRKQLVQVCYQADAVKDLFEDEMNHLLEATRKMLDDSQLKPAHREIKLFVQTRERRYRSLKRAQIDLANGQRVTCREAEAIMEFEEGALDSLAIHVLADLGIMTPQDILTYLASSTNEPFYRTGLGQMILLSRLNRTRHSQIFHDIQISKTPVNLFQLLRSIQ